MTNREIMMRCVEVFSGNYGWKSDLIIKGARDLYAEITHERYDGKSAPPKSLPGIDSE